MNGKMIAAAGLLCAAAGCMSLSPSGGTWYRGMLSAHTYWSDGEGGAQAFPEQAADAYRRAGYSFVSITDHNTAADDPAKWQFVFGSTTPSLFRVTDNIFTAYTNRFPGAECRKLGARPCVRLKTQREVKAALDAPGRFLVLPGSEVTRKLHNAKLGVAGDLNFACVNLNGLVEGARGHAPFETYRGSDWDLSRVISHTVGETTALAAEQGNPPFVAVVSHPLVPSFDIAAEALVANPGVRFAEVCSRGTDWTPPAELDRGGWEADHWWDVVNAFRARDGKPLLFATASDSAGFYPGSGLAPDVKDDFGHGWICVRAPALTADDLMGAMLRGDFYASCGVELEDVSFADGTLSVKVPAKPGVRHAVRFIVTKRGFPTETKVVTFPREDDDVYLGTFATTARVRRYSDEIGKTAKLVEGKPGEALAASYAMADDDLYVRARVESDQPLDMPGRYLRPRVKAAWTQPYVR